MPPHQPAGTTERAVRCEGVLNAGTTKGTPVAYHGSPQECLEYLRETFGADVQEQVTREEHVNFPLPRELRQMARVQLQ